jgi:hypothetical protein
MKLKSILWAVVCALIPHSLTWSEN